MEGDEYMRIDEDSIFFDDDQLAWYQGKLYTGIAYSLYPDGSLARETQYVDGYQEGPERTWGKQGQLLSESRYHRNVLHGDLHEWYEDGSVKIRAKYEYGVELEHDSWAEGKADAPETSRRLKEGSVQAALLADLRRLHSRQ